MLIRQGWEAFLPDMGLNKFVRVTSAPRPIPKANYTWLGKDSFLPQKGAFEGSAHHRYCLLWVKTAQICYFEGHASTNAYATAVFETCSVYTHYGTPFLRPSAYKARVGGVSPWCGIEQIRTGGSKGRPCLSQSRQYLIGERFLSPIKRRIFVGGMNLSPIRYSSRFLFSLWYKCFFFLLR